MTGPNDDALGDAVARIYATMDPPPPPLLRAASSILAWRAPDTALAELLLDSALAGTAPGIRAGGPGHSRMLSFGEGDMVLDLELTEDDGTLHVTGQISRAVAADLVIRHSGGTWTGRTDAVGRFTAPDLQPGPLRVTWGPAPDGTSLSTPTILPG